MRGEITPGNPNYFRPFVWIKNPFITSRGPPLWWFQIFFMFPPIWGNDPIWHAHMFQLGGRKRPTRKNSDWPQRYWCDVHFFYLWFAGGLRWSLILFYYGKSPFHHHFGNIPSLIFVPFLGQWSILTQLENRWDIEKVEEFHYKNAWILRGFLVFLVEFVSLKNPWNWISTIFFQKDFQEETPPGFSGLKTAIWFTRRWVQIFVIFTPTWGNDPIWLIFFKWVETTN